MCRHWVWCNRLNYVFSEDRDDRGGGKGEEKGTHLVLDEHYLIDSDSRARIAHVILQTEVVHEQRQDGAGL